MPSLNVLLDTMKLLPRRLSRRALWDARGTVLVGGIIPARPERPSRCLRTSVPKLRDLRRKKHVLTSCDTGTSIPCCVSEGMEEVEIDQAKAVRKIKIYLGRKLCKR